MLYSFPLLIVPQGIETFLTEPNDSGRIELLIVPQGIETVREYCIDGYEANS